MSRLTQTTRNPADNGRRIDVVQTTPFITALKGSTGVRCHFQWFDDSPLKRLGVAGKCYLSVDKALPKLEHVQAAGAGAFIGVNTFSGSKRSNDSFVSSCASFADDDAPRAQPRTGWPIAPNIVVESSPGKYHYYWLTRTEDAAAWTRVQRSIAKQFGTDASVIDPARVMRLPGTWNLKNPDRPHLVRIVDLREGCNA